MFSITLKKSQTATRRYSSLLRRKGILMLLFTGAVVQLYKKRDQPDLCAIVSGDVPLQNSWKNDVTGQQDFPCDNSDTQHPFKHTKCSSHI